MWCISDNKRLSRDACVYKFFCNVIVVYFFCVNTACYKVFLEIKQIMIKNLAIDKKKTVGNKIGVVKF